ncbi:uncharacterized protein EDB91DRAFT_1337530 [Suillus paluster]|uniref:uncharacterized protein n=1 Tax=Suillus paluster TaxID=48578 RepID=UPI001B883413|nr:uncharacterized protein EDB91DRAFT_1337530 [Suillus paluster]KAG1735908.1 hypothetical protein EDB91DRAFT_1337530 [Suillus paluster]
MTGADQALRYTPIDVLYTEDNLRTTMDLLRNTTIEEVKQKATAEMLKKVGVLYHYLSQMPFWSKVYLVWTQGKEDTRVPRRVSDSANAPMVRHQAVRPIVVVSTKGSLIMDTLDSKLEADLAGARLILEEEEEEKRIDKNVQNEGRPDIPWYTMDDGDLMSKVLALQQDMQEQTANNVALQQHEKTGGRGGRVLLDIARNKLAMICGFVSNMAKQALAALNSKDRQHWLPIVSRPTALHLLLHRNRVRDRGDWAAHTSAKDDMSQSILVLKAGPERDDMTFIFRAVFDGGDPVQKGFTGDPMDG